MLLLMQVIVISVLVGLNVQYDRSEGGRAVYREVFVPCIPEQRRDVARRRRRRQRVEPCLTVGGDDVMMGGTCIISYHAHISTPHK